MKELGPLGGVHTGCTPLNPPMPQVTADTNPTKGLDRHGLDRMGLERTHNTNVNQSQLINGVNCQLYQPYLHSLSDMVLKDIGLERSTHVNPRSTTPIMISSYFLHLRPPQNSQHCILQMITAQSQWHQRHHPIICPHLASLDHR